MKRLGTILLIMTSVAHAGPRRELLIAAASDLRFALDEAVAVFEKENSDINVRVIYGSSGNFAAQIGQKAPFDLFFSADSIYPQALMNAGLVEGQDFTYAVGCLVLWVPRTSSVPLEKQGMKALLDPRIRKIAVANPVHAPYGKAAIAAMKAEGVYDAVRDKLVFCDTIAQAAQWVQSGAVDAGAIALGLALSPRMKKEGRYWMVPLSDYPKLVQSAVLLKNGKDLKAARSFQEFITLQKGRSILGEFGFTR